MSWEAVGAVGEIVGAAAVVASLVYLAVPAARLARPDQEEKLAS